MGNMTYGKASKKQGEVSARVPDLVLTQSTADFIREVARVADDDEVGGVGYCRPDDDGDEIVVDHAWLIPQKVTPGGVEFDREAVAIAQERAVEDGRLEDLRFSFHSHGSMSPFWSATDEQGIKDYLQGGSPYLVSVCVNAAGDIIGRLDVKGAPIVDQVTFEKMNIKIISEDRTEGEAERQFKENVKRIPYATSYGYGGAGNWNNKGKGTIKLLKPSEAEKAATKILDGSDERKLDDDPKYVGLNQYDIQGIEALTGKKIADLNEDQITDALIEVHCGPEIVKGVD